MFGRRIGVLAIPIVALVLCAQPALAHQSRPGASIVEVTAGEPSEFHFTISKTKLPLGAVTFHVTNEGTLPHDFKIAGKKTKLLSPGQSQTLVVKFEKAGRYAYVCTVTGHAVAGMRGALEIAAPAAAPPRSTTDRVTAGKPSELRFALSRMTVPLGIVSFKVVNKGSLRHDFRIAGKKTRLLAPGGSETLKVIFKKAGRYPYRCTVAGHAAAGMRGMLVVSTGLTALVPGISIVTRSKTEGEQ
jgi:uncharacterized cupredoxin-like copper-binding protein